MRRIKKMGSLDGVPFVEKQPTFIVELREYLFVVTNASKLIYSNHVISI